MDRVAQLTNQDLVLTLGITLVGHQKKIMNSVQTLRAHMLPIETPQHPPQQQHPQQQQLQQQTQQLPPQQQQQISDTFIV